MNQGEGTNASGEAAAMKDLAIEHLNAGGLFVARTLLEAVTTEAPSDAQAWYALGVAQTRLADHSRAAASFERAIALNPEMTDAHLNLGNLQLSAGRYADAEASYRRVLDQVAQHPVAYLNLGRLFALQGQYDRAVKCYTAVLRLQPTDSVLRSAKDLSHALLYGGHAAEATSLLEAYSSAHGDEPDVWAALARLYIDAGKLDQAARSGAWLVKLRPDEAVSHLTLALLQVCRGDGESAASSWVAALQRAGSTAAVEALRRLGAAADTPEARAAVEALPSQAGDAERLRSAVIAVITAAPGPALQQAATALLLDPKVLGGA